MRFPSQLSLAVRLAWFGLLIATASVPLLAQTTNPPTTTSSAVERYRDTFQSLNADRWEASTAGISAAADGLHIKSDAGNIFIADRNAVDSGTLVANVTLDHLSQDSTAFYYLGFQTVTPWAADAIWIQVQDKTASVLVYRRGGQPFRAELATLEAAHRYQFRIEWTASKVSFSVDDHAKLVVDRADLIPATPLRAFFGANTGPNANAKASFTVHSATLLQNVPQAVGKVDDAGRPIPAIADRDVEMPAVGKIAVHKEMLTVEDSNSIATLNLRPTLAWISIRNKSTGRELLAQDGPNPVFIVSNGQRSFKSTEFACEHVDTRQIDGGVTAELQLKSTAAGLSAKVTVSLSQSQTAQMQWQLTVKNDADHAQLVQPIFPLIDGIVAGATHADTSFFFPWRTGLAGSADSNLACEYGAVGSMGVMAAYDRNGADTLYTWPVDSSGQVKGMVLNKGRPSASQVRFDELIQPLQYPQTALFSSGKGVGIAYYQLWRSVAPAGSYVVPPSVIATDVGGWKTALKAYRGWVDTWYRKPNVPQWFMRCFNFLNQHPDSYYSDSEKRYIGAERLAGTEDVLQWAFFEQSKKGVDPITGRPLSEYQPGSFQYSEDRGGLEAFKAEIDRVHARNARFTVYLNHRHLSVYSDKYQEIDKKWAAMSSPGVYAYYGDRPDLLTQCFYQENAWADYMAKTCGRLVRETGMDGIYLDELNFPFPCYNPDHDHMKDGRGPCDMNAFLMHLGAIRSEIKSAKPDAVLWTEHVGSDVASQYIDGAWIQTYLAGPHAFAVKNFDEDSLYYFRFVFPEVKLAAWGNNTDGYNRCFFNAVGVDMGNFSKDMTDISGQALQENADVFAGLNVEPAIPVGTAGVKTNRFGGEGTVAYTLYNKNQQPVQAQLNSKLAAERNWVDVVEDEPIAVTGESLNVPIKAEAVTAVVGFTPNLHAKRSAEEISIELKPSATPLIIKVFADNDRRLPTPAKMVQVDVAAGSSGLTVPNIPPASTKWIVKLFNGNTLIDEVIVPADRS